MKRLLASLLAASDLLEKCLDDGGLSDARVGETPIVVSLDDLQWADPWTVELISALGRRPEPARLLVIATYRLAELPRSHALPRVASELVAHGLGVTLPLEAFDEECLGAYLAQRFRGLRFPSDFAAAVHRSTGGNPLLLGALLDDLQRVGKIREMPSGFELTTDVSQVLAHRPDSVRRLIDARIDRLGANEQKILEVAAVAGLTFAAGVVADVLELPIDDVEACCTELADERGLLRHAGSEAWPDGTIQSRYTFAYGLLQQAALTRTAPGLARLRHGRVARRLETGYREHTSEIAQELALHFDEAKIPANAAHYYNIAGKEALRRDGHAEAMAYFERARHLLGLLPDDEAKVRKDQRVAGVTGENGSC